MVMLNDVGERNVPIDRRSFADCDAQGNFSFHRYTKDDGALAGTYVETIAQLKPGERKGYIGPDRLKNLYNDPDRNSPPSEFNLTHGAPGKTDYVFDLQCENREPVKNPGRHALTQLGRER